MKDSLCFQILSDGVIFSFSLSTYVFAIPWRVMGLVVISGSPFHWECSPLASHLYWRGVQGTCRAPDLCILWFPVHDTRQQKLKFIWFNKWRQSKSHLRALGTLLSSFFYLVFWPESLLLSCQLINALRKIYFPAFLVVFFLLWEG